MTLASTTPPITAMTLFLKPISRKLAARVPVHAPVPGNGMPTLVFAPFQNFAGEKIDERYWQDIAYCDYDVTPKKAEFRVGGVNAVCYRYGATQFNERHHRY